MQTLNFPTELCDQENTFTFAYPGGRRERVSTGYLFSCKEGLYILQTGTMLKDCYTERDVAERTRLNAMTPVRTGDIVLVEGKQYQVKILGDYSDAGRLIAV